MSAAQPTAVVNRILDSSVVDGPGNRTAIFFQGCNFRCGYCHNPETMGDCVGCGGCVAVCPAGALQKQGGAVRWQPQSCVGCDRCLAVCPHSASPKTLRMTAQALLERVEKNLPFIRGITCSGGECTLSGGVMAALFAKTHALGLTNLIDSNGSYDFAADPLGLLTHCDGVMLDIKAFDPAAHRALTGCDNAQVLQNAVTLAKRGLLPEIRTVVLADALPNAQTVREACRLLAPLRQFGEIRYRLIRFRPNGVRGAWAKAQPPPLPLLEQLRETALQNGFADVVIT